MLRSAFAAGLVAALGAPAALFARSDGLTRSGRKEKALIVYYSRTGNTRTVAERIQRLIDADVVELKSVTPYPSDYTATTRQAKWELDSGYLPPLSVKIADLQNYDVIFLGSPNWWGTFAAPVRTFLSQYDLSGKTVAVFMTHEGSGLGRAMTDLKAFCPEADVLEGLAVQGGRVDDAQRDVERWLEKIGLAMFLASSASTSQAPPAGLPPRGE